MRVNQRKLDGIGTGRCKSSGSDCRLERCSRDAALAYRREQGTNGIGRPPKGSCAGITPPCRLGCPAGWSRILGQGARPLGTLEAERILRRSVWLLADRCVANFRCFCAPGEVAVPSLPYTFSFRHTYSWFQHRADDALRSQL